VISHEPVLVKETVSVLAPQGKVLVDCTAGEGGHLEALLVAGAEFVLGIDKDSESLAVAEKRLSDFRGRFELVTGSFGQLASIAGSTLKGDPQGVLFDLGLSSRQLDRTDRGFSFQKDEPLDMRFDPSGGTTAFDLANRLDAGAIEKLLREKSQVREAKRIARAIVNSRDAKPIRTTLDLVEVVRKAVRVTPRTMARVFQAFRMEVNREEEELESGLRQAIDITEAGGVICVISYHSVEHRKVKDAFRSAERGCTCPPDFPTCRCGGVRKGRLITRKAMRPGREEVAANPRSRSGFLRALEVLD
jgi:16S rRNA (cytosine1402-N4)-methyltransferase